MKVCFRICVVLSCIASCSTQTPVIVNTDVGNIMGFKEYIAVDGEQKLISKFLGIPFAESTAGANRFRKPIPKAPFQSTFDARKVPLACYQQSIQESEWHKLLGVPGFSEDCLTLNIYVPHGFHSTVIFLPVMIWIYGGGFTQGAASFYNPEILALFGNVVVVTMNYRVGMFGFLRDRNGKFPGNQGLWDQHLAIKWVNNNIDKFFGYKDEITIFGESAGGASVLLQAIHPGNKGLFKRVIAESGTAISSWTLVEISNYEVYLKDIGCSPNSRTSTFTSCLQSKDPTALQSNITYFGPAEDHDFLIDTPEEIIRGNSVDTAEARDFFASLDIIVGVNSLDGAEAFFYYKDLLDNADLNFNISRNEFRDKIIPYMVNVTFPHVKDNGTRVALQNLLTFLYTSWERPDDYITVRNLALDMANDANFFFAAVQTADVHAKQLRGKTYFYEFAVDIRGHISDVPAWMKGSAHFDEVPFVFGVPLSARTDVLFQGNVSYTAEEKQVSRAMMAFWSNFAKSGNPNFPLNVTQITKTTWPVYSMTSQRYFRMSNQMSPGSVLTGFHPRRMAFWSYVISAVLKQQNCHKSQPDIVHFDPSVDLVG